MLKNLFRSQLRLNMASGVFCTGINAVAMMIAYPLYLYFLGFEKYGVWLVLSTVLSFAQLGNLGIGGAVMKLVAEEHGRNNIDGIQKYLMTAISILLISGSIALAIILIFKSQIVGLFKLSDENARTAMWLLPYIGILSIYVFVVQALSATLSGLGRMDLVNYTLALGRIIAVGIASFLLFTGRGIESLLIGNSASYIFIHIVSLIYIYRIKSFRFIQIANFDTASCKRLLKFGGWVFGDYLTRMLLNPFNKLMLSRYVGVSVLPVYEIASGMSMQARGLVVAGLRAMIPEISRLGAEQNNLANNRIDQIYKRAIKVIWIVGLPCYIALYFLAVPLLKLWLGHKYVEILPSIFQIILIGTFLNLLCVPAYYTLMALYAVRHCFISTVVQAITNIFIIFVVVLVSGKISLVVFAWSTMAAYGMNCFYILWQKSRIGIWQNGDIINK